MGFYIRKGFNFGPLRLNLSRSGLGASFGVTGARIGIGPRGTYVHVGRGGFYYRQTLSTPSNRSHQDVPNIRQLPSDSELQEITSTAAITIVDSSADRLLQELSRVKRRTDLLPIVIIVGAIFLVRFASVGFAWWILVLATLILGLLSVAVRHFDVTNGTLILTYSLQGDAAEEFSRLQTAIQQFGACRGIWHVDASAGTTDWKRNAGAGSLERRSGAQVTSDPPAKVLCNIKVPTLRTGRKAWYFFPDRVLFYDSSGVGAVLYSELNARAGQTRFIEDGFVPSDASHVGTTWKYVSKSGGPDRRFNNNRQLPVVLYGELYLTIRSGVNEEFQCSVPAAAMQMAAVIAECGKRTSTPITGGSVSFASPAERSNSSIGALAWAAIFVMAIFTIFPYQNSDLHAVRDNQTESDNLRHVQEEQSRQQFTQSLGQRFASKHVHVETSSINQKLFLHFVNEVPKAARRDGLQPFDKQTMFKRVLSPNTESELCVLGFRTLVTKRDNLPANESELNCTQKP